MLRKYIDNKFLDAASFYILSAALLIMTFILLQNHIQYFEISHKKEQHERQSCSYHWCFINHQELESGSSGEQCGGIGSIYLVNEGTEIKKFAPIYNVQPVTVLSNQKPTGWT
ncbi:hypothetical protein Pfo_024416 [Paulownia fortunei]|nr:hypothetical protein Pfo_024416 [Paulownia fortunei]